MYSFNCQIILVTGGYDDDGSSFLDSTEIFSDNVWRTLTAKLPTPTNNMAVATINNRVLLFGNSFLCCLNVKCISSGGNSQKKLKDILEFNLLTESWTVIGAMKEPRIAHAVSVVHRTCTQELTRCSFYTLWTLADNLNLKISHLGA